MMYKGRKIHKSTMFFLIGVLIWLLYGTHYEEVAFAQGGEVEPTLVAEVEPTATAVVQKESFSLSQGNETTLARNDSEKWADTAKELIEAVDQLLDTNEELIEAVDQLLDTNEESPESGQESAGASDDVACFGTFGFGVTCLDQSGWTTFNSDNSSLANDWILDMVV